MKIEEFPNLKIFWPWPWTGSHGILSCSTNRPPHTHQTSFESDNRQKLFLWTDGRTRLWFVRDIRRYTNVFWLIDWSIRMTDRFLIFIRQSTRSRSRLNTKSCQRRRVLTCMRSSVQFPGTDSKPDLTMVRPSIVGLSLQAGQRV